MISSIKEKKRELCDIMKYPTVRAAVLQGERCQGGGEKGGQKQLEYMKCKERTYWQCGKIAGGKLCFKQSNVWKTALHENQEKAGEEADAEERGKKKRICCL